MASMKTEITPSQRQSWADKLKVSEQYLYQCLTGRRDMGPIEASRIEVESNGALTRKMLCQKTWHGIWPELAKQPRKQRTQAQGVA